MFLDIFSSFDDCSFVVFKEHYCLSIMVGFGLTLGYFVFIGLEPKNSMFFLKSRWLIQVLPLSPLVWSISGYSILLCVGFIPGCLVYCTPIPVDTVLSLDLSSDPLEADSNISSPSIRAPNPVYSDKIEFIETLPITPPVSEASSSLISAKDYVVHDDLHVSCNRSNYCSTMAIISMSLVGFTCVGIGFFIYYLPLLS